VGRVTLKQKYFKNTIAPDISQPLALLHSAEREHAIT
jgi:hypothetical protein